MCELFRLLYFDCEIFGMRLCSLKKSDLHIDFSKSFLHQGDFDPANSMILQFALILRKSCSPITRWILVRMHSGALWIHLFIYLACNKVNPCFVMDKCTVLSIVKLSIKHAPSFTIHLPEFKEGALGLFLYNASRWKCSKYYNPFSVCSPMKTKLKKENQIHRMDLMILEYCFHQLEHHMKKVKYLYSNSTMFRWRKKKEINNTLNSFISFHHSRFLFHFEFCFQPYASNMGILYIMTYLFKCCWWRRDDIISVFLNCGPIPCGNICIEKILSNYYLWMIRVKDWYMQYNNIYEIRLQEVNNT